MFDLECDWQAFKLDTTVAFFGEVGRPNDFSKQLLQNVADRAGTPAVLRIGANTQDRASYCSTCNETITTIQNRDPNDPKQSEALFIEYNANFFKVMTKNVPTGSPIIFGLNFRNSKHKLSLLVRSCCSHSNVQTPTISQKRK